MQLKVTQTQIPRNVNIKGRADEVEGGAIVNWIVRQNRADTPHPSNAVSKEANHARR